MRFDNCPTCRREITSFVRPIGTITCPYCKTTLKFVAVPPESGYGAYRRLVEAP